MAKRKIALFYDEQTESGKQILDFLTPFAKRKSDIVGELILLWIAEHGTNVPVQWLDRRKGELGKALPYFPKEKRVQCLRKSPLTRLSKSLRKRSPHTTEPRTRHPLPQNAARDAALQEQEKDNSLK